MAEMSIQNNNQQERFKCRICMISDESVVQLPCKCKNDIALIHQSCLLQWINLTVEKTIIGPNTAVCDVCHSEFRFEGKWGISFTKTLDEMLTSDHISLGIHWVFIQLIILYFTYELVLMELYLNALAWMIPFTIYGAIELIEIRKFFSKKYLTDFSIRKLT